MKSVLRETLRSVRASPIFAFYVLATLAVAGFNGGMVFLMMLDVDLPGAFGQMTHGTTELHRTHDLTFAFLFMPLAVGMVVQLWRPAQNIAGQLMALIPWAALVLTLASTFVFTKNTRVMQLPWITVAAVAVVAALLHPAGRHFFRSFEISRTNRVMLALVGSAAVPLLVFASTNIRLQGTVSDTHAFLGHYGFMAGFSFTVIGIGLLASLRPDGWKLAAWVTGLLPVLLGLTSVMYPNSSSSLGAVWALAAMAWGIGFVAAAEIIRSFNAPKA